VDDDDRPGPNDPRPGISPAAWVVVVGLTVMVVMAMMAVWLIGGF
jgi:hypothetical protein